MIRKLLEKLRLRKREYPNRFLKFYYLNKKRLIAERRQAYHAKRETGICVRCHQPSLPEIIFCSYHQECHKKYNLKARSK